MSVAFWVIGLVLLLCFGGVVFLGAPYVPSRRRFIRTALTDLYPLGKDDVLIDVGSGDGVVLQEAARLGASAIGYEINPFLVAVSRWRTRHFNRVQTRLQNFWRVQLPPETTIVYVFGDGRDIARIGKWLECQTQHLKSPLMVLSYGFKLPNHQPIVERDAYYLYKLTTLHDKKPQV